MEIERHPDLDALAEAAARRFAEAAKSAVAARREFLVALSGGRTPLALYEALAGGQADAAGTPSAGRAAGNTWDDLPWGQSHLFWGDERWVPADDPRSNFRLAREHLLSRVPVPPGQVHPVPVDAATPEEGAARWEAALRGFFSARQPAADFPVFDLIVLGMGADGHVASLFPGDAALDQAQGWTAAVAPRGDPRVARLTLTLPLLLAAREVLLLATGPEKVSLLEAVQRDDPVLRAHPIARLARRPICCMVSA